MADIDDWQSVPEIRRVQNKNRVATAFKNFYAKWKATNGGYPTSYAEARTVEVIDEQVRIPAWISTTEGGVYCQSTIDNLNYSYMLEMSTYNNDNSFILRPGMRMLPKLVKLSDFLAKYTTPYYTQYWITDFQFFLSSAPPGGMHFIPWQPPTAEDLYVLENYDFYTNYDDVERQILHMASDWNPDTRKAIFDSYIPAKTSDGKLAYIPYMGTFKPVTFNTLTPPNYGTKFIGKSGGVGEYESGLSGINTILCTGEGNFVENPGTPGLTYDIGIPRLTERPKGGTKQGEAFLLFKVANKRTWEDIFNASGLLWSYDLEDILPTSDEKLHKPTYPGQPVNPTGGGEGDGDNISDDIPLPVVNFYPNANAYNRYWIKPSQLVDVQKWLFSDTFVNDIGRLWNDPAEYLINLTFYPFDGHLHDVVNSQINTMLAIGNLTSDIPVISMLDGYNAVFEGGTFDVKEYYGTYLDYAPYTSAEIYIPYIGYRTLNINDIMGKEIRLRYAVDFDTNLLTATLLADEKPLTMYSGAFGVKIALSGSNANQIAETIVKTSVNAIISAAGSAASGSASGAVEGLKDMTSAFLDVQFSPRYFGNPSPSTALYNTQIPHLIIHRPITAEPTAYSALRGYSAGYSGAVSEFSGFLKCSAVNLPADTTMSAAEQEAAKNILTGGIYL